MKTNMWLLMAMSMIAAWQAGCRPAERAGSVSGEAAKYLARAEPAGAIPVGQALRETNEGDEVAVVGYIGGSAKPFVEGVAVFTIVDPQVPYCSDEEGCPTPWDYCCHQHEVKSNIATVKITDDAGHAVRLDPRKDLKLSGLDLVAVRGKAQRDEAGNLTILAEQVFVKLRP